MTSTVVNAEQIYADPSALLKLYLHEGESAVMSRWRAHARGALPITPHGRLEIVNGICLAAFRKAITGEAMRDALDSFDEDGDAGRYVEIDVPWRATLRRAVEISRTHALRMGSRSLDVLHVATALELGLRRFVTFDRRQHHLARATGLTVTRPAL